MSKRQLKSLARRKKFQKIRNIRKVNRRIRAKEERLEGEGGE